MPKRLAISGFQSDTMIKGMMIMKTMLVRKAVNYEQAFTDTKDLIQKFGGRIEDFDRFCEDQA